MRSSYCIIFSFAFSLFTFSAHGLDKYKVETVLRNGSMAQNGHKACFNLFLPGESASDPIEACSTEVVSKKELIPYNSYLNRAGVTSAAISAFLLIQPFSDETRHDYGQAFIDELIAHPRDPEYLAYRQFTIPKLIDFVTTYAKSPDAHKERLRQIQELDAKIRFLEQRKNILMEDDLKLMQ